MHRRDRNTMARSDEPSVRYKTEDHIAVIFQMYASVWGNVLPMCIATTTMTFFIYYYDSAKILDLSISDKGHTFMSAMVSFLMITRTHVSMQRYMEARHLISELMRSCRELIQHAAAFSRYEQSKKAQKWRADISRRTCSMLRTVVTLLKYNSKNEHVWQAAELSKAEKQALLLAVGGSNERSPLVLTLFLRTAVSSHVETLSKALDVNQELKLLSCISEFVTAYHGLMKLITTPFPFPLVQMTRTFLLVWVFTLPFALASDIEDVIPLLLIVFFGTYGFMGLELISIEMEDPFGNDPNDFDVKALAEVVYSDIYVVIEDIDGRNASQALKKSVQMPLSEQIKNAVKSHNRYSRMKTWGGDSDIGNSEIDRIAQKISPKLRTIHAHSARHSDLFDFPKSLTNDNYKEMQSFQTTSTDGSWSINTEMLSEIWLKRNKRGSLAASINSEGERNALLNNSDSSIKFKDTNNDNERAHNYSTTSVNTDLMSETWLKGNKRGSLASSVDSGRERNSLINTSDSSINYIDTNNNNERAHNYPARYMNTDLMSDTWTKQSKRGSLTYSIDSERERNSFINTADSSANYIDTNNKRGSMTYSIDSERDRNSSLNTGDTKINYERAGTGSLSALNMDSIKFSNYSERDNATLKDNEKLAASDDSSGSSDLLEEVYDSSFSNEMTNTNEYSSSENEKEEATIMSRGASFEKVANISRSETSKSSQNKVFRKSFSMIDEKSPFILSSSSSEESEQFKSNLCSDVRKRLDSNASIEVIGTNEKVTYDEKSNTIKVKRNQNLSPRRQGVAPPRPNSRRLDADFDLESGEIHPDAANIS